MTATGVSAQNPAVKYHQISSEHFRVTYQEGLEHLAGRAAARAETAYALLTADLVDPPKGTIDITIVDDFDYTNGFATPIPTNRIVVYARPPTDLSGLDYFSDWFELVVTHELTHTFHIDRSPRFGRFLRKVFGRVPLPWLFFPSLSTPGWNIEGLAVVEESRLTGMGRVDGSYHEMIIRTAVLEDRFDPLDRSDNYTPIFPGGERVYIYGSLFLDYVGRQYGPETHKQLVARTVSRPPWRTFNGLSKKATGKSFRELYDEWHDTLRTRYASLADSLRARGLTATDTITRHGYYALQPRVSPDGAQLSYVHDDGRNVRMLHVRELASGSERELARLNTASAAVWLPDGSALITSRLDWLSPQRAYADLYRVGVDGSIQQLTRGLRIEYPDVSRNSRIIATKTAGGTVQLVLVDAQTGAVQPITRASADTFYTYPRWSPDGARIAASRWTKGGFFDVVVLDTLGNVDLQITHDRALDLHPAWSPDGRWLLFSSDRSGIPNIYAVEAGLKSTAIVQVTNVLTGAFFPELSRDGRALYFVAHHADGYHIERTQFDPAHFMTTVQLLGPDGAGFQDTARAIRARADARGLRTDTTVHGGPRSYSPLRSMLPHFWLPLGYGDDVVGVFLGFSIAGLDLVHRHSYGVTAAYAVDADRLSGLATYTFAGLSNPLLGVSAVSDWSNASFTSSDSIVRRAVEREQALSVNARFARPRAFSTVYLDVGATRSNRTTTVLDPAPRPLEDPDDDFVGVNGSLSFVNARRPVLSISREDGFSALVSARRRWDIDRTPQFDATFGEATTAVTGYRALELPGFAHHVVALRGAARVRDGPGAEAFDVGGSSGGTFDPLGLPGTSLGGSRLLPVRGFTPGTRRGTRGWAASLEYRVPVALVGRALPRFRSVFIDRVSATAFLDAGNGWCTGTPTPYNRRCQRVLSGGTFVEFARRAAIAGTGGELAVDLSAFGLATLRLRGGLAFPVAGYDNRELSGYVQFGQSF
jgi:Tol biopolymer transport system component